MLKIMLYAYHEGNFSSRKKKASSSFTEAVREKHSFRDILKNWKKEQRVSKNIPKCSA